MKQRYPVLAELENRVDAGWMMRLAVNTSSTKNYKTDVLSLLMTLEVFQSQLDEKNLYDGDTITDVNNNIVVIRPTYTEPAEG